ncbi:MAG TPA: Rdx family protein [Gemmatimonadaceae bacterium]|nr:Rdx family protein [Gemmatimonadaceae bacterium]
MRQRFPDAELQMTPSRGGRFEVAVDGKPVFEKSKLGRHARAGEILSLIEKNR